MAAALERPDPIVVQRECLASYKHCPASKSVITRTHNKFILSRNGFYYSGTDNIVKCYYCDVGIEKVEDMKRHGKVCVGTKIEQKDLQECATEQGGGSSTDPAYCSVQTQECATEQGEGSSTDPAYCSVQTTINTDTVHTPERPEDVESDAKPNIDNLTSDAWLSKVMTLALKEEHVEKAIQQRAKSSGVPYSGPVSLLHHALQVESSESDSASSFEVQNTIRKADKVITNELVPTEGTKRHKDRKRRKKKVQKVPNSVSEMSHGITSKSLDLMLNEESAARDEDLCIICIDDVISVVILPCGHFCCCASCAASLQHCPVCRTLISNTVRLYPV